MIRSAWRLGGEKRKLLVRGKTRKSISYSSIQLLATGHQIKHDKYSYCQWLDQLRLQELAR